MYKESKKPFTPPPSGKNLSWTHCKRMAQTHTFLRRALEWENTEEWMKTRSNLVHKAHQSIETAKYMCVSDTHRNGISLMQNKRSLFERITHFCCLSHENALRLWVQQGLDLLWLSKSWFQRFLAWGEGVCVEWETCFRHSVNIVSDSKPVCGVSMSICLVDLQRSGTRWSAEWPFHASALQIRPTRTKPFVTATSGEIIQDGEGSTKPAQVHCSKWCHQVAHLETFPAQFRHQTTHAESAAFLEWSLDVTLCLCCSQAFGMIVGWLQESTHPDYIIFSTATHFVVLDK